VRAPTALIAILSIVFAASIIGAQDDNDRQRRATALDAVNSANAGLRGLTTAVAGNIDEMQYRQRRDNLMGSIHRAVDRLIEGLADHRTTTQLEADLLVPLREHVPEPEYGEPPSARAINISSGSSLFVTFNIGGPRNDNIPSVRAYTKGPDARYALIATTGDEFERFTVRSRLLRSPLSSEGWLLVWGRAQTFNGTLIRFRVYSFDGEALKTIWAPEDMVNADITIRDDGFRIKHLLRDRVPWETVRDEYLLTPDGVLHTGQQLVP
jgi:hypothetical protein